MRNARVKEPQSDRRLQRFGAVIDALAELPEPQVDEEFARALEDRLLNDRGAERHLRVVTTIPVVQGWNSSRARKILAGFAVAACLGGIAVFNPFGAPRESTNSAIRPPAAPSIDEAPGARVGPRAPATVVETVQRSTPGRTSARPPAQPPDQPGPPGGSPGDPGGDPPDNPSGPQDLLGNVTITGRRVLPTTT